MPCELLLPAVVGDVPLEDEEASPDGPDESLDDPDEGSDTAADFDDVLPDDFDDDRLSFL